MLTFPSPMKNSKHQYFSHSYTVPPNECHFLMPDLCGALSTTEDVWWEDCQIMGEEGTWGEDRNMILGDDRYI